MKRTIAILLSFIMLFSFSTFNVSAEDSNCDIPVVLDFVLTTGTTNDTTNGVNSKASGLIFSTALEIRTEGTELIISGKTSCSLEVVKCGFKDLMVQRRASSSDSWRDYYEYGNVYTDGSTATIFTRLAVARGYQYRVTCKHYAKKSLLVTQTIDRITNIATVS